GRAETGRNGNRGQTPISRNRCLSPISAGSRTRRVLQGGACADTHGVPPCVDARPCDRHPATDFVMAITSIKGFRDVLPAEADRRRDILDAARAVLKSYGYGEIELPLLEKVELFKRSVGDTSDIVEKEMYAFEDRDGATIALRPEGTASLVRAYLEAGLARAQPVARLWYTGPMFRRERPQKGRYRQFSQIGAEFLGREDAAADAETICLVADICHAIGMRGMRIHVNSLGDATCRPAYRQKLADYGRSVIDRLCDDCRARLDRNPLRLLDCKNEGCRLAMEAAPQIGR